MNKFLAGLLAFAFILGFALSVIGWSALEALFTPKTYTAIIANPQFTGSATDLVREQVKERIQQETRTLGSLFTAEDAQWVAAQLVSDSWFTAQLERWLGALFDWLKSDTPQPQLILSLADLKQEAPAVAEVLVANKLRQLPPCTLEKVAQALEALLTGREIPLCLPPNFDVEGFVRSDVVNLRAVVADYMRPIPDSVDLLALSADNSDSLVSGLNRIRLARQEARRDLTILGAALLVIFLLIGLLRWKPKRALLQWWGWALLLGGGLALAIFGGVYAMRAGLWAWVTTSPNGAWPADVLQMAQAAFDGILSAVWSRVLLLGGAGAAAGFVLAALSLALPRGASSGERAT